MALAFDAASSGNLNNVPTPLTLTVAHTCSGTDRVLIVDVACGAGNTAGMTVTVTYNGVSMTSLAKVAAGGGTAGFIEKFYLLNPASGTNNIVATRTDVPIGETTTIIVGGKSYNGASQTAADYTGTVVSATGNSVTPSVTTGATASTSIVDDGACAGLSFSATGAGQTQQWQQNVNGGSRAGNGKGSTEPGTGGAVTMSHTQSGADHWVVIAVEVKSGEPPIPPEATLQSAQAFPAF